jgi:hypothetical protein
MMMMKMAADGMTLTSHSDLDWTVIGDYVHREGIDPEIALKSLAWCGIIPDEEEREQYLSNWQKWSKG